VSNNNQEVIAAADRLAVEVGNLGDQVGVLIKTDKRRAVQFVALAVSVVLDLLLSAGFYYALRTTHDAQERIEKNSATLYTNCVTLNEQRQRERKLWEGLITLPKAKGQPENDPKTIEAFMGLLDKAYPIEDCAKLKH
jgi:hypothetical protein